MNSIKELDLFVKLKTGKALEKSYVIHTKIGYLICEKANAFNFDYYIREKLTLGYLHDYFEEVDVLLRHLLAKEVIECYVYNVGWSKEIVKDLDLKIKTIYLVPDEF